MSLISALIMMFILSAIAATLLFAFIRLLQPHKRKIYAHQTVKHAADKLPYQIDLYGEIDTGDDWKLDENTGQFTKTLWDGTVMTWDNDPSGQVRTERQAAETGKVARAIAAERREQHRRDTLKQSMNSISSDVWKARINRPDGFIGWEKSAEED